MRVEIEIKQSLKTILGCLKGLVFSTGIAICSCTSLAEEMQPPNIVVIFLDDSGWADFQPFGEPAYDTPHVDQLVQDGCRYNQFYVPQAICSASRAALLTGCYPGRTKVFGAHGPRKKGLDPKYPIISEILKERGYATAMFGKWHVGDQPATRPPARGFDESCGLMYSNDMWKYHPGTRFYDQWPLQFWKNGRITIEDVSPADQKNLTQWYTEHAVDFIDRHKDEPFFLYVPHSMPHVPLFCSEEFEGKSGAGLYGDVIMELDGSVGQIEAALKENGLEDNTIVVFTSDNGPWISYGDHAGTTPFREAKKTSFDGGVRSACIVKYPGRIKAGATSDKAWCSIDLLPTLCGLAGASLPSNPIDGKDVFDLIAGTPGDENPHEYYPFSTISKFEAIITGDGRWKLQLPHTYKTLVDPGEDGTPGTDGKAHIEMALFDMVNDPYETTNVMDRYPERAEKLKRLAEQHKARFYK